MNNRTITPSSNPDDKYAVAIVIECGDVSLLESYPDEELLEKGYNSWKRFAEYRGLTKPVRIMFIDAEKNPSTYRDSKGRCRLTDSELIDKLGIN